MPEIAEVAVFADGLQKRAQHQYLTGLFYDQQSRYARCGLKNIKALDAVLPLKILDISSRGKKIVFSLAKGVYLISSLGLTGRLDFCSPTAVVPDDEHSNLWITLSASQTVNKVSGYLFYTDSRHMGEFKICLNKKEFDYEMRKVGKDLLKDDITEKYFIDSYRAKKNLNKPICEVMLDQEKIAGIGNWMRAEILYHAKISPWRTIANLSDTELELILRISKDIALDAYRKKGATLNSYLDFEGQPGSYVVEIYGKEDDPTIQSLPDKGGRTMWWRDSVQK